MNVKSLLKKINSWADFQETLSTLSKKQKGDAFELLTKLYFKINPVYKSYYDEVWLLDEVPQKDLDYLNLKSQDLGIDLIAKSKDEYHAIQCKYHSDRTSSVTFSEISTFTTLVEGNPKITKGYICSSADVTSKNFDKVKTDKIIKVMSDSWEKLDEDFFQIARKFLDGKTVKLNPLKPREHQKKALKEANTHFEKEGNSRGKLIFPCGAGKSLTGYWITKELESKSTIIAVPSLSLVKQTLEVYLKENFANNKDAKWLCICSDEGIGRNDDVATYTADIGVPCVTDTDYIENWLIENKDEEIIVFTTYQSGKIIADISKRLNFTFDVGIFDEAHKTVGSDKKLFSHLLFDENITVDKRIFMTATERFYQGSKDDIISMDDSDIYGDTFAYMSFKEAIERNLLTDYKVITIEVKKSEISNFIRENKWIQLNDKRKNETEARSLASMLALRKAMKEYPIKNAVSFHSSIEKAVRNKELQKHITDAYNYKPIDTYTVSGKVPTTKRSKIVKEFASSSKALITNARCLTEGVDVPNIDCIVFADPRKSRVDIVQALGRALRKKEGKESGYVVLPIVFDEETKEISDDNFSEILAVVSALASNDERIVEYLKDVNNGKPKTSRDSQFQLDVFSEYLDETELTEQLQIRLWEKLARLSWMPFEEAREYVRELGLISQDEWREFCKSGEKPNDIPKTPSIVYKNKGWFSMGDWLGTGTIASYKKVYRSFFEAREFVRKLDLRSQKEWLIYCKSGNKPEDIPASPKSTYKNEGWKGIGDWIGTGTIANFNKEYRQFKEARKYTRGLGLKNGKEWTKYCKSGGKPIDIPTAPNQTYKDKGWKGMGDWLGTGSIANYNKRYRAFSKARNFVQGFGFKSSEEYRMYSKSGKKPIDIPSNPNVHYSDKGWVSWGNWLGTGRIADGTQQWRTFSDAKNFVIKLGLTKKDDWINYCKSGDKPYNIPNSPRVVYKNKGWVSWGDWLRDGKAIPKSMNFRPFEEARSYARKLDLRSQKEWLIYCKSGNKPKDIPLNADRAYKDDGWRNWGDWLGSGTIATQNKVFLSYEEAKKYVRGLKIRTNKEWRGYLKSGNKPNDIPSTPEKVYKNKGWKGWADFLGKDK